MSGNDGADGGGVRFLQGELAVLDSTISANQATRGGAVAVGWTGADLSDAEAEVVVERSTVVDDTATRGAGVSVCSGTAVFADATLSGNHATVHGGALEVDGDSTEVELARSTVAANSAPSGSSIAVLRSTLGLSGTAIAGAGPGTTCAFDSVTSASSGYDAADASCGLDHPTDQPGATVELASLADNGGPTATHLSLAASVLIDAIPLGTPGLCDASAPTDQRGVARPQGAGRDIGAVER